MALKSRFGYRTSVPNVSSRKGSTKQVSFTDGRDTYTDNDDMKPTALVDAVDARWIKKGRYKTRRGADHYSVPVGEAINVQRTSTTGASTYTVNGTSAFADKLTIVTAGRITRTEINIRSTSTSKGVLLVEYYTNNSGVPGTLLCRSSFLPADITSTFTYKNVYFLMAPLVAPGDIVWCVIRGQDSNVGDYQISTTTSSATGLTSNNGGLAWSAAVFAANIKTYSAPSQKVKGLVRVYRPNGQKITFFAYGTTIASINDATGVTTALKADFSALADNYRFQMVQDALYVVNGREKPWKYDLATNTWTQITQAPWVPSLIMEHKGLIMYNDVDDKTRFFFTNFADYITFTSTDFIYAPAPKSYDSLVAFAKLNGAFYPIANRNKFVLLGTDDDTFSLDEAPDQRGTLSQESLVFDANFIFHADLEGVHQFNGTDSINLAGNFLEEYNSIADKNNIVLDIFSNRLYMFYGSEGSAANDSCIVINLLEKKVESRDTNTPFNHTFGRYAQDDLFLLGSNLVAAIYYGELPTNDYHNLGDQMQYELDTSYSDLDVPGAPKRIPKWRPQFPSVSGEYSIQAGYDKDMQGNPQYVDVDISSAGIRYDTGELYDTGDRYTGFRMIEPKNINIPGTFNRIQRRYKHVAAREPVEFDSEVLTVEVQRVL